MTLLTDPLPMQSKLPEEQKPARAILPEETPIEMPHQDLAISPVVSKMTRWVFMPGNAARFILTIRRRRSVQESHHVA